MSRNFGIAFSVAANAVVRLRQHPPNDSIYWGWLIGLTRCVDLKPNRFNTGAAHNIQGPVVVPLQSEAVVLSLSYHFF
jgi:hypothetical protein